MDTEFLGDLLLLSGVNLSKEERWIIFGKSFSSGFIFWSELFAVTTIIECTWLELIKKCCVFDETRSFHLKQKQILTTMVHRIQQVYVVLLDFIVEVIVSENENSIIGFNTRYKVDCSKCN